jgi:hypothetical protein
MHRSVVGAFAQVRAEGALTLPPLWLRLTVRAAARVPGAIAKSACVM